MTRDAARPTAVVAGYAIRFPLGGMTWVYLHHMLGLAALGFDVVYVEAALWPRSCYDPTDADMTDDPSAGLAHLRHGARHAGLGELPIWYVDDQGTDAGMSREEAESISSAASVLVNVGATTWHPAWAAVERRILVDCDAPFTQLALHRGVEPLTGIAANHDVWATIATNVARRRCPDVPLDRPWVATRPPVHTPAWPVMPVRTESRWTTVTSWGSSARDEWCGVVLGNKADAYADLLDLPTMAPVSLELAVASDAPIDDLRARGWHVVDPVPRTQEASTFAAYVAASRGELAVAKAAYAAVGTGAMNDRSLAYLASGRPVVTSDVGFDPDDRFDAGLVTFRDVAGAASALDAVEAEHHVHAAAARKLVEDRYEAADVAADLLLAADVEAPTIVPGPVRTGPRSTR